MNEQTPIDGAAELVQPGMMDAIIRSEIDVQISTAKRYPRSIAQFKERALAMATLDEETAASCIYCRPVGKERNPATGKMEQKYAEGMSVRMAEIVGASYGNLRVGAMLIEQTPRQVKARGYAHDLESNFASGSEFVEATVTKDGNPFSERMRAVVAKACIAKARRDATFQVVPRALCKPIEAAARKVAIGDAKSLASRRQAVVQWLSKLHIDMARVWAALEISGPDDITLDHLTTLTGLRTAIKDGDITVDDAFPSAESAPRSKTEFRPAAPKTDQARETDKAGGGASDLDAVPADSGLSAQPKDFSRAENAQTKKGGPESRAAAEADAAQAPPRKQSPAPSTEPGDASGTKETPPAPATQPSDGAEPVMTEIQADFKTNMEEAGVDIELARSWLGSNGLVKDPDSISDWIDIKEAWIRIILTDTKRLKSIRALGVRR